VAKHSETLVDMVVYKALYDNEMSKLWAWSLDMFVGEVEINGVSVPRFKYIGEE